MFNFIFLPSKSASPTPMIIIDTGSDAAWNTGKENLQYIIESVYTYITRIHVPVNILYCRLCITVCIVILYVRKWLMIVWFFLGGWDMPCVV